MASNESSSSLLSSSSTQQSWQELLQYGFHFVPENGELIDHYLRRFYLSQSLDVYIPSIKNLYQHPEDLQRILNQKHRFSGDFKFAVGNESYFFSELEQKSENDARIKRSIRGGYWKTTSDTKPVQHNKRTVGQMKRFKFFDVDEDGKKKTDWIMYQYTINRPTINRSTLVGEGKPKLKDYVLCKLYKTRSSCDSSRVRSNAPPSSSCDITSVSGQIEKEYCNDRIDSSIPQPSNIDSPTAAKDRGFSAIHENGQEDYNGTSPENMPTVSQSFEGHPQQGAPERPTDTWQLDDILLEKFQFPDSGYWMDVPEWPTNKWSSEDILQENFQFPDSGYSMDVPEWPTNKWSSEDILQENFQFPDSGYSMDVDCPLQHSPLHREEIFCMPRETLQTQQEQLMNEGCPQLWDEKSMAPADMWEHFLMNDSQQQHAHQHQEDEELLAFISGFHKPQEEENMQMLMNV